MQTSTTTAPATNQPTAPEKTMSPCDIAIPKQPLHTGTRRRQHQDGDAYQINATPVVENPVFLTTDPADESSRLPWNLSWRKTPTAGAVHSTRGGAYRTRMRAALGGIGTIRGGWGCRLVAGVVVVAMDAEGEGKDTGLPTPSYRASIRAWCNDSC